MKLQLYNIYILPIFYTLNGGAVMVETLQRSNFIFMPIAYVSLQCCYQHFGIRQQKLMIICIDFVKRWLKKQQAV